MNSEKERMLNREEKTCRFCKNFNATQCGHRSIRKLKKGFCKRVVDGEDVYVNDFKIDVIYHINTVTTTASGSCGFWRKI